MTRAAAHLLVLLAIGSPCPARACLGFYVSASGAQLPREMTRVVVMREGDATVLSVQPGGGGADQAFVLPIPSGVRAADVRVSSRDLLARVEALSAPRLAEYWEEDPCSPAPLPASAPGTIGGGGGGAAVRPLVTVDARLIAGEYEIVILRGRDAAALEAWLRREGYPVPDDAGAALRPYLEARSSFLVARVDPRRERAEHALLSPLRVHYQSPELVLPVRLARLGGSPELVVHVLARERYEAANRPNAIAPTDLVVSPSARERLDELYAALFARVTERNPGAVITEYARRADACEPCATRHGLSAQDLEALGADVVFADMPAPPVDGRREVRAERLRVRGPLEVASVERALERRIAEVRFCYQEARGGVAGRLPLYITIDAAGRAETVRPVGSTLRDELTEECIVRAVRSWSFPPSTAPSRIDVTYDLSAIELEETARARAARERERWAPLASELVLTRLRYRSVPDEQEDLVLRPAPPIEGGAGVQLRPGSRPALSNALQTRFAITHPWTGTIPCGAPMRGVWGANPSPLASPLGASPIAPRAAPADLDLTRYFPQGVPALGIAASEPPRPPVPAPAPPAPIAADGGCAIAPRSSGRTAAGLLALALVALRRRHPRAEAPVIGRTRAARRRACGPR